MQLTPEERIRDFLTTEKSKEKIMYQTYTNSIFIPLLQNLIAAACGGSIPFILSFLFDLIFYNLLPVITLEIKLAFILISLSLFAVITLLRYTSDEIKYWFILKTYYIGFSSGFSTAKLISKDKQQQNENTDKIIQAQSQFDPIFHLLDRHFKGLSITQRDSIPPLTRTQYDNAISILKQLNLLDTSSKSTKIIPSITLQDCKVLLRDFLKE